MAKKSSTRTPLGRELAKLRIDADEQLATMAQKLNINSATLRRYEVGLSAPDLAFFENLKATYGADLSRFYEPGKVKRKGRNFLDLDALTAEQREQIMAILYPASRPLPVKEEASAPARPRQEPDVDGVGFVDDDDDDLDSELEDVDIITV